MHQMKPKPVHMVLVLLATVMLASGLALASGSEPRVRVFEHKETLFDKDEIELELPSREGLRRVIADVVSGEEIEEIESLGCRLRHRLSRSTSFECPEDVVPQTGAREASVFRVHGLESDQQIGADQVWPEGILGAGAKVAVLDTGIDSSHVELSDSILGQKDFVDNDDTAEDIYGHGTHVAGIITGNGVNPINGNYAKGVAPDAGIYMLKVCDDHGYCLEDDIVAAMEYTVNSLDARIMSLSLGGGNFGSHCDSDPVAAKANWVADNGILVVASSGNEGSGVSSPACGSKVVAVGVADKNGIIPKWSNRGSAQDIVAPGVNILSSYSCMAAGDCSSTWYAYMSGTSMSAPHVSGTAALLLEAYPSATADELKDALYTTADTPSGCEKCFTFWGRTYCFTLPCTQDDMGAGIVDAYGAYQYILSLGVECLVDADCHDGLYCNGLEKCEAGACQSGTPVDCSGLDDQCNSGLCDEGSDTCTTEPRPDGTSCDDGLFCNVGETCQAGTCTGGTPYLCNASNPCTNATCNELTDSCDYSPLPDGLACDDGQFCSVNDACSDGACQGQARDCSDTTGCTIDTCDDVNDICVNTPDDSYCDDGSFCNGAEICDALSGCLPGSPLDCNDGNECTTDSCNEATDSCEHTSLPDNSPCSLGLCCSGFCIPPACSLDSDCNDMDACTTDSCLLPGTCSASCSYSDITSCINGDGCCPGACDFSSDSDCPPEQDRCWDGSNTYLMRGQNQLRKFCKCAQGDYYYRSYGYAWGRQTAFKYSNDGNNENWDTESLSAPFPAYRVRCADGNWYYTDQDYLI